MLAQIADLRFCALMSAPLCPVPFCLRPYVVDRISSSISAFIALHSIHLYGLFFKIQLNAFKLSIWRVRGHVLFAVIFIANGIPIASRTINRVTVRITSGFSAIYRPNSHHFVRISYVLTKGRS